MKALDASYVAGFLDGDGSIHFQLSAEGIKIRVLYPSERFFLAEYVGPFGWRRSSASSEAATCEIEARNQLSRHHQRTIAARLADSRRALCNLQARSTYGKLYQIIPRLERLRDEDCSCNFHVKSMRS